MVKRCGTSCSERSDGIYVLHSEYEALERERDALREDKARLDWLDMMNAALNRHYGTAYQWKVILSHHITRLMTGRQWAGFVGDIDLNDSQCGDGSFAGCRAAIDEARGAK